jgi:hypothetical protein
MPRIVCCACSELSDMKSRCQSWLTLAGADAIKKSPDPNENSRWWWLFWNLKKISVYWRQAHDSPFIRVTIICTSVCRSTKQYVHTYIRYGLWKVSWIHNYRRHCYICSHYRQKIWKKCIGESTQSTVIYAQKIIATLLFKKFANFLSRKVVKIAKISDHNIEAWHDCSCFDSVELIQLFPNGKHAVCSLTWMGLHCSAHSGS